MSLILLPRLWIIIPNGDAITPVRTAADTKDDNPTNTVNFTVGGKYSSTSSVSQAWSEAETLTLGAQSILVPPYCKAIVDKYLVKTQAKGVLTMVNTTTGDPVINATIGGEMYSFYPTYPFYAFKDSDNVRNRNLIFTYDENNQPALGLRVRASFSMDAGAQMVDEIRLADITPGSCKFIPKLELRSLKDNQIKYAPLDEKTITTDNANGLRSIIYRY